MRGVDAVIITTGYKGSLLDTGGFKQIDQIGAPSLWLFHCVGLDTALAGAPLPASILGNVWLRRNDQRHRRCEEGRR